MSHRGRKLAALFITLLVLGLVLNNISSRTRDAGASADGESAPTAPAARPLSPLYVPRPASLISGGYGGALSSESTPQEVAQAFTGTYVTYDPAKSSAGDFVAQLPRLAPDATQGMKAQLDEDWDRHLSQLDGTPTVTSVSDPDPAVEQKGEAAVTVIMNTGSESEPLRIGVELKRGDTGWMVASMTLDGE